MLHNDYIVLTREYLRRYKQFLKMRDTWLTEIKELDAELSTVHIAGSKYGTEPPSGESELNATESAADKRLRISEQRQRRLKDCQEIERLTDKIKAGLDAMPDDVSSILTAHYIDGVQWDTIAYNRGYSYQGIRKRGSRGIKRLAEYLFGLKAMPSRDIFLLA